MKRLYVLIDQKLDAVYGCRYLYKVGDKVLTPFGIQTIKTIMKHCSSQPGYEWIILVEENENEYKPCELIGIVVKELTLEQWNQIIE